VHAYRRKGDYYPVTLLMRTAHAQHAEDTAADVADTLNFVVGEGVKGFAYHDLFEDEGSDCGSDGPGAGDDGEDSGDEGGEVWNGSDSDEDGGGASEEAHEQSDVVDSEEEEDLYDYSASDDDVGAAVDAVDDADGVPPDSKELTAV
jgi:hypothetical protein